MYAISVDEVIAYNLQPKVIHKNYLSYRCSHSKQPILPSAVHVSEKAGAFYTRTIYSAKETKIKAKKKKKGMEEE